MVPNANAKTKIAVTGGAVVLLGAGYGASVLKDKWEARKQKKKTEESQREWREKSESGKEPKGTVPNDDDMLDEDIKDVV